MGANYRAAISVVNNSLEGEFSNNNSDDDEFVITELKAGKFHKLFRKPEQHQRLDDLIDLIDKKLWLTEHDMVTERTNHKSVFSLAGLRRVTAKIRFIDAMRLLDTTQGQTQDGRDRLSADADPFGGTDAEPEFIVFEHPTDSDYETERAEGEEVSEQVHSRQDAHPRAQLCFSCDHVDVFKLLQLAQQLRFEQEKF